MISVQAPGSMVPDLEALDAIAFDFDGVLCDSVAVKSRAFAALYADHGEEVVAAVLAYHHAHGGISRQRKIRHFETCLLGRRGEAVEAEVAAKSARFSELVKQQVIASPLLGGALEFLEAYSARLRLYVVSGTPEDELRDIVRAKGIGGHFRDVLGAPTDKETHLRAILTHESVAAGRLAMIGDAMTDYDAAAKVGCRFVGICGDGRSPFPAGTVLRADLTDLAGALMESPGARP